MSSFFEHYLYFKLLNNFRFRASIPAVSVVNQASVAFRSKVEKRSQHA